LVGTTKAAVGNYVAVSSTHFNADGQGVNQGQDSGGTSGTSLYDSISGPSKYKQLGGNGAIPFWNRTSATDLKTFNQVKGATHAALSRDGTSNTIMFAESREEDWTSWVSGFASYVVAADPGGPGKVAKIYQANQLTTQPAGVTNAVQVVGFVLNQPGQTALNVGQNVKRAGGNGTATDAGSSASENPNSTPKTAYYYQKPWAHASGNFGRVFGPSSAHSGDIVLHGFGDAHGKSINANVDRNVYLWQVTRGGGEVISEQ